MLVLILMAMLASGCLAQEIVHATACELEQHPELYHHKLVEVTSAISREFENFTLADPSCSTGAWIEYGGKKSSQTIYCCPGSGGVRKRSKPLIIDGIETKLVDDKMFRKFDKESKKGVQARLVGRFFAKPREGFMGGYGHFGCCNLFVIERVFEVQPLKRE